MRYRLNRTVVAFFAVSAAAGSAFAADPAAPPPASESPSSGAYSLNLLYTGEAWDNTYGGLRQGWSYMENADAQLSVDTGKALGWTGGTFFAEGFYANAMSTGNKFVGALDQQSPIDTAANVEMFRLYQLYYDQNFGQTDVRFGIYDLETEFSNTKPMSLFLSKNLTWNTALDQAGTMPLNGTVGPGNYPYTPLALRVRQDFGQGWSGQFAIANGAADDPNNLANNGVHFSSDYGALFIGEVDYTPDKHTKLMAGAWGLTSKLPLFGELNPDGSQRMTYGEFGGYVGAATRLYSATPKQGLDAFFTFGASSPQTTNVGESFNAGLVYTGPFNARPADKIGVSMNINAATDSWKQYQVMQGVDIGAAEESFELTYRAKINEYVTLQPDIQYIVQPAYSKTLKNPVVLGIHFEIGKLFTW
jgi:porin